jgi:hypothetical protein
MSERTSVAGSAARGVTIDEIVLADEPGHWERLGFAVEGDLLALGAIRLRLAGRGAGKGIVGWSLRGTATGNLDGLPSEASTSPSREPAREPACAHPNGVSAIDHVVAFSPQLDRTIDALRAAGLDLRRVREEPTPAGAPRQAFFRLGEAILEVVQIPAGELARAGGEDAPARFWGLALIAGDLERCVAALGEHVSEIRAAVQPGRQIATLRRSAGLAVPVALMSVAADIAA